MTPVTNPEEDPLMPTKTRAAAVAAATAVAVLSPINPVSPASPAAAACGVSAANPVKGYGGIGGTGSILCDGGRLVVVNLERKNPDGSWSIAAQDSFGYPAESSGTAFQLYAPNGTYRTHIYAGSLGCPCIHDYSGEVLFK
ncbi:MAG: hypothetical protein GXY13_11485 [Acidimicrobiales bacterium]|mgnify:CR=1 FL=1|nr:hypothetical protein [Acidimicrobiales bacterium]